MTNHISKEKLFALVEPFTKISEGFYTYASEWRTRTGGKVIGITPMYTPEEIVHAAGILPVTLLGNNSSISKADEVIQPTLSCSMLRSVMDMCLTGKLDFLDGVIFNDVCSVNRLALDILKLHHDFPFLWAYTTPRILDTPSAKDAALYENTQLKQVIEKFIGKTITEAALRNSIAVYNKNRQLLTQLYELRKRPSFPLTASEVEDIVLASMWMPKEDHNELLEPLVTALQTYKGKENGKVRIMLAGTVCMRSEKSAIRFIEEQEAKIVDDDLWVGRRSFYGHVSESGDPLEALADHFIHGMPCCTKRMTLRWADNVLAQAKASEAEGVLAVVPKFCDLQAYEFPDFKELMEGAGLPQLWVEVNEPGSGVEQIKTRLQAFSEVVAASKED